MYKSISKQAAKEMLLQIKVARAYAEWYTSKDKNVITISTLHKEGLHESAEHVRFLCQEAVTLGALLNLPEGLLNLDREEGIHMADAVDAQVPCVYFDQGQAIHLYMLGKVMGINSKTCELYVYSFKQGWQEMLHDHRGSFALKNWAYVFPLGKYGIYVNEPGKLDDEVFLRQKDSWLLRQTRSSQIDNK